MSLFGGSGIRFAIGANVSGAVNGIRSVSSNLKQLNKDAGIVAGVTKGLGDEATNTGAAFEALALAVIGVKLATLIQNSTLLAGRVENLGTVLNNVGRIAGYSEEQIFGLEERVKALGITTQSARQSMALMAQAQLDLSKSAEIARVAQDAAVIAGVNSSEANQRLVLGIQRTNTWMLRNVGILVNLNTLYAKHSAATGRAAVSLSAMEKQTIVMNEVLRQGANIAGTYEAAMTDAFKQFTSMERITEEASRTFGESFLPAFAGGVQMASKMLKAWIKLDPATKAMVATLVVMITTMIALTAAFKGGAIAVALFSASLKSLAATPAGAALLALGVTITLITTLFFGMAAAARASEARVKAFTNEVKRSQEETFRLRRAFETIEELGKVTDRTAQQQAKFDTAMNQTILLLPKYALELRQAKKDTGDFLALMIKANPDVTKNFEEMTQSLVEERARLEQQIIQFSVRQQRGMVTLHTEGEKAKEKKYRDYIVDNQRELLDQLMERRKMARQGQLGVFTSGQNVSQFLAGGTFKQATGVAQDEIAKLAHSLEMIDIRMTQVLKSQVQERAKAFIDMGRSQEVAHGLAMKAMRKFATTMNKEFTGTVVAILNEYDRLRAQLSSDVFSPEGLESGLEAFRETETERFVDSRNRELEALGVQTEEIDRLITESNGSLLKFREMAEDQLDIEDETLDKTAKIVSKFLVNQENLVARSGVMLEQRLQEMEDIRAAFAATTKLLSMQADEFRDKSEVLERTIEKGQAGIDSVLIRSANKRIEIEQKNDKVLTELQSRRAKKEEQLVLQRANLLTAAAGRDAQLAIERVHMLEQELEAIKRVTDEHVRYTKAQLEKLDQEILDRRERLNQQLLEKMRSQLTDYRDLLRGVNDEQVELARRAGELIGENMDKTLVEVNKAIEDMKANAKKVEDFLRDAEASFRDKDLPGFSDTQSRTDQFLDMMAKATSPEQVTRLMAAFEKDLKESGFGGLLGEDRKFEGASPGNVRRDAQAEARKMREAMETAAATQREAIEKGETLVSLEEEANRLKQVELNQIQKQIEQNTKLIELYSRQIELLEGEQATADPLATQKQDLNTQREQTKPWKVVVTDPQGNVLFQDAGVTTTPADPLAPQNLQNLHTGQAGGTFGVDPNTVRQLEAGVGSGMEKVVKATTDKDKAIVGTLNSIQEFLGVLKENSIILGTDVDAAAQKIEEDRDALAKAMKARGL